MEDSPFCNCEDVLKIKWLSVSYLRQVSWKFQEIDHFMFQLGIGWRLFLFLFFHTLIEAKLQNTQTYRRLEFVAHLKHQE